MKWFYMGMNEMRERIGREEGEDEVSGECGVQQKGCGIYVFLCVCEREKLNCNDNNLCNDNVTM